MSMKIHGKMLVKNFKKAFSDEFGVGINVHNGFSTGSYAEDGATLSSIRSDKAGDASGELDLHGNMSVATAENAIKDALGFKVQILDKAGKNADNAARLSSLR
jgi:tryptophanase